MDKWFVMEWDIGSNQFSGPYDTEESAVAAAKDSEVECTAVVGPLPVRMIRALDEEVDGQNA